jgi:hypothetical protein
VRGPERPTHASIGIGCELGRSAQKCRSRPIPAVLPIPASPRTTSAPPRPTRAFREQLLDCRALSAPAEEIHQGPPPPDRQSRRIRQFSPMRAAPATSVVNAQRPAQRKRPGSRTP